MLNFWLLDHNYIHYSGLHINIPGDISRENAQHYTNIWDSYLDIGEANYYMSHQHRIYNHRDNIAKRMSTMGEAIWSQIFEEYEFLESRQRKMRQKNSIWLIKGNLTQRRYL